MSYNSEDYLLLDSSIRDWVIFPIVLILVFVGIGRHHVQELIKSETKIREKDMDEIRFKQIVMQSQRLRTNGNYISERAFQRRYAHLLRKKTGILREQVPGAKNPMSNPMAMMDAMKGNMVYMIPNIALMSFIGYFFSGFLCVKVPFPMPSNHFRSMLQSGIDLRTLNISYVSSLSWYFLVTFGLNGVYGILLGGNRVDEMQMQMQQMGMGMVQGGAGQPGFDAKNAFQQERDTLAAMKQETELDKVERRILGDRYPDPSAASGQVDLSKLHVQ